MLAAYGYECYSSAVRPMALAPDGRTAYLQLSVLHGFVEFDLEHQRPLRIAKLPIGPRAKGPTLPSTASRSTRQGTTLCVAATMSDYAAIVSRDDFRSKLLDVGRRPYRATNSADSRYCFVSANGDDRVAVISYADERVVATIPVGDHP